MELEKQKIIKFTDLNAWQENHKLLLEIYKITKFFPKEELFCLVSQIRRASLSVTSNIAEGFGRKSYKEKLQFYYLAKGSLVEVENQAIASKDIGYIKADAYLKIAHQINISQQLLQGLINKTRTYIK